MRRIPYIVVKDGYLKYICPRCKKIIPRDLYKIQELCPNCDLELNKVAKSIMKVYRIIDKEFYDYFISINRR